jgi:enoyl-CoA hydratase/carnithine racemase
MLTSANDKFFSIGWDIPELFHADRKAFSEFLRSFQEATTALYSSSKPTVAAITGHATAGGCILALCCDRRVMAEGRRLLGLNEVKLGVTVPYSADLVLRDLVGSRLASKLMEGGEFYSPGACLEMGLVDRVAAPADVRSTAVEVAASLGLPPPEAFAAIKRNRVEQVLARIALHADEREREFVELWYSPTARARLREAMARF